MTSRNPKSSGVGEPDILTSIVSQVLAAGANAFEVEYKDGEEQICVMHGPVGFGIGSLKSSSPQAQELRARLYRLTKKRQKIGIDGIQYLLTGETFESFGEDAFRVRIESSPKQG